MADINIAELRKLLAEATPDFAQELSFRLGKLKASAFLHVSPNDGALIAAAVNALPGVLDENDRLVSRLALSGRALEEANQSITELEAEVARLREANRYEHTCLLTAWKASMDKDERIAQLEAALGKEPAE